MVYLYVYPVEGTPSQWINVWDTKYQLDALCAGHPAGVPPALPAPLPSIEAPKGGLETTPREFSTALPPRQRRGNRPGCPLCGHPTMRLCLRPSASHSPSRWSGWDSNRPGTPCIGQTSLQKEKYQSPTYRATRSRGTGGTPNLPP
jgi:hypothetical protein